MVLPFRAPAALALLLVLGVAGCGGDDGGDGATGTEPTGTPSATSSPAPSPGASFDPRSPVAVPSGVPTDFPTAEVPLLAGAPVSQPLGEGSAEEGKRGWVLEQQRDQDFEACFEEAQAVLTAAGFAKQPGAELRDAETWQAQFVGETWVVILAASPADGGGCRLSYSVGQLGPGGPR